MIECHIPNACAAVGDFDACKATAIAKRIISNACDAVRDRNACQAAATGESLISNACDTSIRGYDAIFAARHQRLTCCLNKAIIDTMINRISACNCNTCKTAATSEHSNSNACNFIRNCDVRKVTAIHECPFSNTRDAVGNGNACKSPAIIERSISNACNTVGYCNACKATAL